MSGWRNGRPADGSLRNYKYRRLSSVENGTGNGYISCEEDDDEIFTSQTVELKKVKKGQGSSGKNFGYEQVVDRPIKSGETLRSIALKYRIPISELKRVNKILQENEFFALNSLKIPIKANSVLSEILDKEKEEDQSVSSARASVLGTRSMSSCSEADSEAEMHVGYISINSIMKDTRTKKEAKRFLDNMKRDLAQIRDKTSSYKGSLDEVSATLTDLRFKPLSNDQYEGATLGISWAKLLIMAALLLIGVPLAVMLYLYSKDELWK